MENNPSVTKGFGIFLLDWYEGENGRIRLVWWSNWRDVVRAQFGVVIP